MWFFRLINFWSFFVLCLVAGYFVWQLNWLIIVSAIIFTVGLIYLFCKKSTFKKPDWGKISFWRLWSGFFILFGDGLILRSCILARTDEPLTSPWLVLSPAIFVIFATVTWLLFLRFSREEDELEDLFLLSIHFFVTFSVATIIYKIGFGFDPFIHRAAETVLYKLGEIEPKQLLYTGQYVTVAALSHLTGLAVSTIDKWLVPVLSAVSLPAVMLIGLRDGYGLKAAKKWLPAFLIIPFLPLVFTVPHNLVFLYSLWIIFFWPVAFVNRKVIFTLLGLGVLSLVTHPLLGLPLFLFTIFIAVWTKLKSRRPQVLVALIFLIILAVSLPASFALKNILAGLPAFASLDFWHRLDLFFGLFQDPYKHNYFPIPLFWQALYKYRIYLPIVLSVSAFVGGFLFLSKELRRKIWPLFIFVIGSLIAIFFTSTLFVFKDVISYEQNEFSLRYLQFLPFVSWLILILVLEKLFSGKKLTFYFLSLVFSIMISFAWYLSYPQDNPKVVFSGPSVSAADIEAVRFIEERSAGENYLVLANQMTAAAALQEFGFAHYLSTSSGEILWYPLPTGGELYGYFSEMAYVEPRRETIEAAMNFAGVKKGYFLVSNYWPYADWFVERANQEADNLFEVDNGDIIILEYLKK